MLAKRDTREQPVFRKALAALVDKQEILDRIVGLEDVQEAQRTLQKLPAS